MSRGDTMHGIIGAALAIIILFSLQAGLVSRVRRLATNSNRVITFFDIIVTSEDERYSISRFQMYLWFITIVVCYTAKCFATKVLADVPQELYILMGINAAAAVASTAITFSKDGITKAWDAQPQFIRDVFFDSKNTVDLPRTQMFVWTLVVLAGFIIQFINSFSTNASLPTVPAGLIILMGISHAAYLGGKAADPK